ncbi:MAG: histidine phosphatase family protein [Spirochaeta sp.]
MHRLPNFMSLEKRLRVYFIRHGQSEGNSQGILQGQKDYPLSELGREQCKSAASYFSDRGIEYVMTSPLLRAQETAEILSAGGNMPAPVIEPRLMELKTGIFTGMTIREIEREYPQEWRAFLRDSWEGVPEAESIDSLWERAIEVWNTIIDIANQGKRHIVVVTHGGLIQWIIKTSIGAQPQWLPLMPTDNCGIFEFMAHPIAEAAAAYYGSWITINATV